MDVTNFRKRSVKLMEVELQEWKAGDKNWNVNNQFNETVLESALESITDENAEKAFAIFGDKKVHAMDLAHFFSAFEAPEMDRAWTD